MTKGRTTITMGAMTTGAVIMEAITVETIWEVASEKLEVEGLQHCVAGAQQNFSVLLRTFDVPWHE